MNIQDFSPKNREKMVQRILESKQNRWRISDYDTKEKAEAKLKELKDIFAARADDMPSMWCENVDGHIKELENLLASGKLNESRKTYYWTCPDCGANLDPGEKCDCKDDKKESDKKEIIKNVIKESRLPKDDRDPQYGIPEQRKYPLFDKEHVESAIRLFGHVEPRFEEKLARAIIAKMRKYNISFDMVGKENKLYKYLPVSVQEQIEVKREYDGKTLEVELDANADLDTTKYIKSGDACITLSTKPGNKLDIQVDVDTSIKDENDKNIKKFDEKLPKDIKAAKTAGVPSNLAETLFNGLLNLSSKNIGAFLAFEKDKSLEKFCDNGEKIDAPISEDILMSIFYPGTKVHDGACVIKDGIIKYASVFFKNVSSDNFAEHYGARHRTAMGLSKDTGAICIVVSEETGNISFAIDGKLEVIKAADVKNSKDKFIKLFNKNLNEDYSYLFESVLDPIHKTRPVEIFNGDTMRDDAREFILNLIKNFKENSGLEFEIKKVYMIGSSTGFQYSETADIDIDIEVDKPSDYFKGRFSLIPKGITLPNTQKPINIFLMFSEEETNHAIKYAENCYDLIANKFIKVGQIEKQEIPLTYVSGLSSFLMNGIDVLFGEFERNKKDLIKIIKLNPNEVQISEKERDDAISKKIVDIQTNADSLKLAHHFLFVFNNEGYQDSPFRVRINYKFDDPHYSMNSLVYKYIDSFGYMEKMMSMEREANDLIKIAKKEIGRDFNNPTNEIEQKIEIQKENG